MSQSLPCTISYGVLIRNSLLTPCPSSAIKAFHAGASLKRAPLNPLINSKAYSFHSFHSFSSCTKFSSNKQFPSNLSKAKIKIPLTYSFHLSQYKYFSSQPQTSNNSTPNNSTPNNSTLTTPTPSPSSGSYGHGSVEGEKQTWLKRTWASIKHEAIRYWLGSKLLVVQTKSSWQLVKKVTKGHDLTRRERRQLQRTTGDMIRMIPFAVIAIVPFMEFALPVLLKFFPNMLPSTFTEADKEAEKKKKTLEAKVEVARFLQETTELMTQNLLSRKKAASTGETVSITDFQEFVGKIKRGERVLNSDIIKYSPLFNDDFTLENLNNAQLAAMCKLLEIRVFGNDWVLRYKIQTKLREIKKDDRLIFAEGVDSLDNDELADACRARGIHPGGVYQTEAEKIGYMKRKLNDWLQLSLRSDVPVSLLVLSRAFSRSLAGRSHEDYPSNKNDSASNNKEQEASDLSLDLATTIGHLPDVVIADTSEVLLDRSPPTNPLEHMQAKLSLLQLEADEKVKILRDELDLIKKWLSDNREAIVRAGISLPFDPAKPSIPLPIVNHSSSSSQVPPVVAAPVVLKEKIAELQEDSDEVEDDINTLNAKIKEVETQAADSPKSDSANSNSNNKDSSNKMDNNAATKPSKESLKEDIKQLVKDERKVDKLNDTLGAFIDKLENEINASESQAEPQSSKPEKK